MKSVLFVCLGNICRSPLAEAIFAHKTRDLDVRCDSAGTAAYHIGNQPDHRSVRVAHENGINISHAARQFTAMDFERFDMVIAMDQNNYRDMKSLVPYTPNNLYLMRDFDPQSGNDKDVPDPYYGGIDGFYSIFDIMSRSIDEVIKHLSD